MACRKLIYIIITLLSFYFAPAAAQSSNCSLASQYYSKDSIDIVTFGASTVQGVGGVGFQGFLSRNIAHCYTGKFISVSNNGIAGETTAQGLLRIDAAIKNRTGFIFILMGANDATQIAEKKITVAGTAANMRTMITKCQAAGLTVILGTLQNYNDTRSPYYRNLNQVIAQINSAYRALASEYKIQLADVNAALGKNFSRLYSDVIHPNNRGYFLLGLVWFDALNRAIENNFLEFYVSQNFPNPAGTSTSVIYTIPTAGKVEMTLYDLNGKLVKYLVNEYENTGIYTKTFDLSDLQNGLYIYVFNTGTKKAVKKMLVAR